MRTILHVDFNSFFATVEQQANPRLRGKPIGVTGGDRMTRTVIGAASVEAKRFGVKTAMPIWEAKQLCPQIILVNGDSEKYLEVTKRFLKILKDYTPYLEVFSIDEAFLELPQRGPVGKDFSQNSQSVSDYAEIPSNLVPSFPPPLLSDGIKDLAGPRMIAMEIKSRIKTEIGEWITCSIGISYNKLMAKLAGGLIKPDGLVVIENEQKAMEVLDALPLTEICGIGYRINKRLNKLGIFNFKQLRAVPLKSLLLEFKSYGQFLYNASRGIDHAPIVPFYQKPEVKSVGHQHTMSKDTADVTTLRQVFWQLTELVARRMRAKKLVGSTVHVWFRNKLEGEHFTGDGMQKTILPTQNGLDIFYAAWNIFETLWEGQSIRLLGVSVSNVTSQNPQNMSLLDDVNLQEKIVRALDKINDRYGEFTLQRASVLQFEKLRRKPNSFISDRRFKLV